jgi:hypothetical protein
MNCRIQLISLGLAIFVLAGASAQKQTSRKAPAAQSQTGDTRVFGQSYATLRPEQKNFINDFVRRYNQTMGSEFVPEQLYDGARMSVRTTFDAVTHALLTTKLTNDKGQSLCRAIDLVDAIDDVMGEEAGVRGDRQFRMYVYLKPNAFELLVNSHGPNLSDMMSSVQSVNELVRPIAHQNSRAFAIMAVPDQMADSFLCKERHLPEMTPGLKPSDAKYGTYYLSDSQLNFGEEESPAFLLLWTKEKDRWKIIAWAVEVP